MRHVGVPVDSDRLAALMVGLRDLELSSTGGAQDALGNAAAMISRALKGRFLNVRRMPCLAPVPGPGLPTKEKAETLLATITRIQSQQLDAQGWAVSVEGPDICGRIDLWAHIDGLPREALCFAQVAASALADRLNCELSAEERHCREGIDITFRFEAIPTKD